MRVCDSDAHVTPLFPSGAGDVGRTMLRTGMGPAPVIVTTPPPPPTTTVVEVVEPGYGYGPGYGA